MVSEMNMIIAVLNICTGIGIITFWILFFTTDALKPEDPPEGWLAHEQSFVLPDSVFSLALIVAGVLLMLGNAAGERLSLIATGGLLFLGLIDCAYIIKNHSVTVVQFIKNHPHVLWVLFYGLFLAVRFIER